MTEVEKAGNTILQIKKLAKEKNAVILVHNYQRPELYEIADYIGDSLDLSRKAANTNADVILFCGVHFMAETAKLLCHNKKVLLPSLKAGCSLADSVTPSDVLALRNAWPEAAVVCYVNTSAAVKAVCDICCTSANAEKVVNSVPNKQVIFLPDENLGRYVQHKTDKEIILYKGNCAIHHLLNADSLLAFKELHPGARIIAHPECREEILSVADYVCSTGGMANAAMNDDASEFIVVTECGMKEKLMQDVPQKSFLGFCNICPYMKEITLENVLEALEKDQFIIEIDPKIAQQARNTVERMIAL